MIAAVVVLAAIVILVLTHRDATKNSNPGLAFAGKYVISSTLATPGIGADSGRPAGAVLTEQWKVSASCPASGPCAAQITPSTGSIFTLTLTDGRWTGVRAMPGPAGCLGAYSFVLTAVANAPAGMELVGRATGVAGGCAEAGTESSAVTVKSLRLTDGFTYLRRRGVADVCVSRLAVIIQTRCA